MNDTNTVTRQTTWHTGREILPNMWDCAPKQVAQHSNTHAYYKATADYFAMRDGLAVMRLTVTYERKDDGKRKTRIWWFSADRRLAGHSRRLRNLLTVMRKERLRYAAFYADMLASA